MSRPITRLLRPLISSSIQINYQSIRCLSASTARLIERPGLDPKPSSPTSVQHVHPADVVAHAQVGPFTEYADPETVTAEVVSGAPNELLHRQIRIYQPTKSTTQSGKGKTSRWLIDWDTLQGAGRWENELMGWASTADYMQGTSMSFASRDEAVAFAEKQGWDYQIQRPNVPKIPPKNYAGNYVHVPGKLRIHHTK